MNANVTRRSVVAALVMMALAACGTDEPTGPHAASIRLNADSIVLAQRDSFQVVPSVLDDQGRLISGVIVTFQSADAAIATISNSGVVASVGRAGRTAIVAHSGDLQAVVPVIVTSVATRLTLEPSPGVLEQKGTLQMVARLLDRADEPIPNPPVTFASSNPSIATISATGLLTSIGPAGNVTVSATSGAFTESVQVAIVQVPSKLTVLPNPIRIGLGGTRRLTGTVLDAVGVVIAGTPVTYTSTNSTLVTVSADGLVTAASHPGAAAITARSGPLAIDVPVDVLNVAVPAGDVLAATAPVSGYTVAFAADDRLYVGPVGGQVGRLDPATYGTATTLSGMIDSRDVLPDLNGDVVYQVSGSRNDVAVFDARTGQVVANIPLHTGGTAFSLVQSRDGRWLYVGLSAGAVDVIDLTTRTVVASWATGVANLHLALHPALPRLYASGNSDRVVELDASSGQTLRTFMLQQPTGQGGQAIALTSNGSTLYVAIENSAIEVWDLVSGTREKRFALAECSPWGLGLTFDDGELYASCPGNSRAVALSATDGRVLRSYQVFEGRRIRFNKLGDLVAIGGSNVVIIK